MNVLSDFALKYTYNSQSFNLALSVNADGSLRASYQATLQGSYVFFATFRNAPVQCSACAALINVAAVDTSMNQISMLLNGQPQPVTPSNPLPLENALRLPIFFLKFFDSYGNNRFYNDGYTFTAYLTTSTTTYQLLSTKQDSDLRFDLKVTQQT